jgi:hypothetical protein
VDNHLLGGIGAAWNLAMSEKILLMVLPAAAVLIILLIRDRISTVLGRHRDKEIDPQFRASLLSPNWAFYERHLQRPAPAALRELYSDMALMTACYSYRGKREGINIFWPLNEKYLLDTREDIGHDIVAFATSGCGDSIYLRPGPNEPNTVYIAYHDDPGNVEVFADSVAMILEKGREVKRAA